MCNDVDAEFSEDTEANIIYSATLNREKQNARRKCSCAISSTSDHKTNLNIVDVRLINDNNTCTPTKLQILDTIQLVCDESYRIVRGRTISSKGLLTVDLDIYTVDPPQMIWISVEGKILITEI